MDRVSARHVYACPMRWGDMDSLGHVNNGVYVDYLQEARVDLVFRKARDLGAKDFSGGLLVARHEINWQAQLVFRERPVIVELWVSRIGGAFFDIDYIVRESTEPDSVVYATARTRLAPFDFTTDSLRRINPEERAVLDELLHDEVAV